jgi:hypothetical protein
MIKKLEDISGEENPNSGRRNEQILKGVIYAATGLGTAAFITYYRGGAIFFRIYDAIMPLFGGHKFSEGFF